MPTNPVRPSFHSPSLQEALDEAVPHVEGFVENLDAISEDIKNLEKYLEASGIRLPVSVEFAAGGVAAEDQLIPLGNFSGSVDWVAESVDWSPADDGNRWRIMYRKVRRLGWISLDEGIVIAGPTFTGDLEEVESRPLIETPVEVRLRAYRALPQLLKAVAEKVAVERVQIPEAE